MPRMCEKPVEKIRTTYVKVAWLYSFYTSAKVSGLKTRILFHILNTALPQMFLVFTQPEAASFSLFDGWFYTFSPLPISTNKRKLRIYI